MSVDPLSDVLRAVRLTGAVFYDVRAGAPWAAAAPAGAVIAEKVMPGAEHLIEYHAVLRGQCWAGISGEDKVLVREGDVIVFPQGDSHCLASEPGLSAPPEMAQYELDRAERPFVLRQGGVSDDAHVICGFLACDRRPFNPLLATLPRVLHLRSGEIGPGSALPLFLQLAVAEAAGGRVGGECVLARLSELLFVEAVRQHVERLDDGERGWLAGLRDAHVGRALAVLHARPAHPWTLDALGRAAGLSRSALAERFAALVGQPPMAYLAQWRMQVASRLLRDGQASIATVATESGYASEAAFSRAFKKLVGVPPATWRRQAAAS